LPQQVEFYSVYAAGTVVVDTAARFLYLVADNANARCYGIGVGKAGLAWSGAAEVGRKAKWPSWTPTDNMIRRLRKSTPNMRTASPEGQTIHSALGPSIYRQGRDTNYRIHGTTEPWTIGKAVSNGCIRMINEHVEDLYERVPVGATVVVNQASEFISETGDDRRL
jgi:lipoprotein-anchoring transpeptidase ErfK/SrfK